MWVYEKNIIKRDVCAFVFFFNFKIRKKYKNNKKKKKELSVLICIWSSILRTNKIMLYFP
jgi:hypothetical protein